MFTNSIQYKLEKKHIRLIFLSTLTSLLAACGENISLERSVISNEQAEKKMIENHDQPDRIQAFLDELHKNASSHFQWDRWWNFLSKHPLPFDAKDENSWESLFRLKTHSCNDQSEVEPFYQYLEHLYNQQRFEPPSQIFDQLLNCRNTINEEWAELLVEREFSLKPLDFTRLNYYLDSLPKNYLGSLSNSHWQKLMASLELAAADKASLNESESAFVQRVASDESIDRRRLAQLSIVLETEAEKETTDGLKPVSLQLAQRSLPMFIQQGGYLERWNALANMLLRHLEAGSLELKMAMRILSQSLNELDRVYLLRHAPGELDQEFEKWLEAIDDFSVSVIKLILEEKHLERQLHRLILKGDLSNLFLTWFGATALGKNISWRRLEKLEGEFYHFPLHQWLLARLELRKKFAEASARSKNREEKWWGDDDECPVPRLSEEAKLVFDRNWTHAAPTKGERGCFKLEKANVENLHLTFDSLIVAPGVDLELEAPVSGIIDLSAKPLRKSSIQVQRGEPALIFPTLFVEKIEARFQRGLQSHSKSRPVRWFLTYTIIREPKPAEWLNTSGEIITQETPSQQDGSDGGDLSVKGEIELPIWIRSAGAAGQEAYPALPSVPPSFFPNLEHSFHHLHMGIEAFLADEWNSHAEHQLFPGEELYRILEPSDYHHLDPDDFRVLSLQKKHHIFTPVDNALAKQFRKDVYLGRTALSEDTWRELAENQLWKQTKTSDFDRRWFSPYVSDEIAVAGFEALPAGPGGNPGCTGQLPEHSLIYKPKERVECN